MHVRGLLLFLQCSDALRISGFIDDVILVHKLRLLDVATRLRLQDSHAALGVARRNTHHRQQTFGTTSCSQGLLGAVGVLNIHDVMFAHNVPVDITTRK